MDGPTPGMVCSSSTIRARRAGFFAFMASSHRMKAHTIALDVDELSEVAHAVRKLRLGNRDGSAVVRGTRERARKVLAGAQVHDAALARGLVAIASHDAARNAVALGGET